MRPLTLERIAIRKFILFFQTKILMSYIYVSPENRDDVHLTKEEDDEYCYLLLTGTPLQTIHEKIECKMPFHMFKKDIKLLQNCPLIGFLPKSVLYIFWLELAILQFDTNFCDRIDIDKTEVLPDPMLFQESVIYDFINIRKANPWDSSLDKDSSLCTLPFPSVEWCSLSSFYCEKDLEWD